MPSAEGQSGEIPTPGTGTDGDSPDGQAQLPDHVIVALLQREHLLMLASLHLLQLRMASGADKLSRVAKHETTVSIATPGHSTLNHSTEQDSTKQDSTEQDSTAYQTEQSTSRAYKQALQHSPHSPA